MYSVKIKTNMRGFDAELSFSHDDPDIFYRKMFSLFNWASTDDEKPFDQMPMTFSENTKKMVIPSICPKHDRQMQVSKKNKGFWYCTALDPEGYNGRCNIMIPMGSDGND